ncbi:MAG: hypothetical protein P8177_07635 [Gemmatimonadota bacterium]|jgi:hypothetical protein
MGIRFVDSLIMLAAAAVGVFSAYLVGHALSIEHGAWAWIGAALCLVVAAALGALLTRRLRRYGDAHDGQVRH